MFSRDDLVCDEVPALGRRGSLSLASFVVVVVERPNVRTPVGGTYGRHDGAHQNPVEGPNGIRACSCFTVTLFILFLLYTVAYYLQSETVALKSFYCELFYCIHNLHRACGWCVSQRWSALCIRWSAVVRWSRWWSRCCTCLWVIHALI